MYEFIITVEIEYQDTFARDTDEVRVRAEDIDDAYSYVNTVYTHDSGRQAEVIRVMSACMITGM